MDPSAAIKYFSGLQVYKCGSNIWKGLNPSLLLTLHHCVAKVHFLSFSLSVFFFFVVFSTFTST